ncbi:MAG: SDR family NAD(P)-dependent oxidoreductase [Rhodobiaceae bacterium]|nr:SDR family NAD(P)-dependent oxidoreductase [Rhodobiaceae bacterium]MCC0054605.1 SDR family NAD(P)-dependent oxidoreductase [Rhodobiaceae bacterium]
MEIAGTKALVTGAASGIGLGMARALARAGASVALADVDAEGLERARAELAATNAEVITVPLDVTDRKSWEAACAKIEAAWGHLNIICNNAGISSLRLPIGEFTPEMWDDLMAINLNGVFNGCHYFISRLWNQDAPGRIVNTASIAGFFATPKMAAYSASKYAVVALSEAIRFEQAGGNLGVSILCPGFVNTNIAANSLKKAGIEPPTQAAGEERANMRSRLADSMSPDEVGNLVAEAITGEKDYIFPHPEYAEVVDARMRIINEALSQAEQRGPADDLQAIGGAWLAGGR